MIRSIGHACIIASVQGRDTKLDDLCGSELEAARVKRFAFVSHCTFAEAMPDAVNTRIGGSSKPKWEQAFAWTSGATYPQNPRSDAGADPRITPPAPIGIGH